MKIANLNFAARVDVDREEAEQLLAVDAINIIRDFFVDDNEAEEAELLVEVRPEVDLVPVQTEDQLVFVELVNQSVAITTCQRVS